MSKKLIMGNEAFAHAALEAGVRVVAGYPGTPSSEVIETVAKLHAAGAAEGVHVEWSSNEAVALGLLAGASYTGARTLFTCKQVGLNVASDPLMSLNYVGVKGGTVVLAADDPGPISSQTEQDTRRFASFAKIPVFDPASPEQGFAMMKAAFEVPENHGTPVLFRPTTRVCHASAFVDVADSTQARSVPDEGFVKDPKWVIFPPRAYAGHQEIIDRLAAIADEFSGGAYGDFNPVFKGGEGISSGETPGAAPKLGIVAGGISAAYAREALRTLEERAASVGATVPAYRFMQVGTPYPFPVDAVRAFVAVAHGQTFGIGIAYKLSSLTYQIFFNLFIIFYNAVMYYGNSETAVRMRINIRRFSVGCPPCMSYACYTLWFSLFKHFIIKIAEPAFCFSYTYRSVFKHRYSGRVIPSVLKF